jgi:tRNA-splicing ligase RtcB (3'-phosphate/5'-hydroxy nucleic acid ligase)
MNGKKIVKLGFTGPRIGMALAVAEQLEKVGMGNADILAQLGEVHNNPLEFIQHAQFGELAQAITLEAEKHKLKEGEALLAQPLPYPIWGSDLIDPNALHQMNVAMRLPISRAGALMPDAHVGYGLPIGGVLATEGAVIPYGVGVDIGCSMKLTLLPMQKLHADEAKKLLEKHTRFGAGVGWDKRDRLEHPVLDEATWQNQGILHKLQDKAVTQLGTSGSGNHFVEFGVFDLFAGDFGVEFGLEAGQYLAILSHSGSRGMGAQVAGHFTKRAESLHPHLDASAKKLSWLELGSEDGEAYWEAMSLAGRYALANHEQIHQRLCRALDVQPLLSVENSHNLAWKQQYQGREVVVHRKGATPAAKGQLGIIPGSMADSGYLVRGKGNPASLESASHGAGRRLGRKAAEQALTRSDLKKVLLEREITLIGGGLDEAPMAYKAIDEVMKAQTDLVERLGRFTPRVVRMDTGSDDV